MKLVAHEVAFFRGLNLWCMKYEKKTNSVLIYARTTEVLPGLRKLFAINRVGMESGLSPVRKSPVFHLKTGPRTLMTKTAQSINSLLANFQNQDMIDPYHLTDIVPAQLEKVRDFHTN